MAPPSLSYIHVYIIDISMSVGAVSSQVNAGPLAYAEAFLTPAAASKLRLSPTHVESLKNIFRLVSMVGELKFALDSSLQITVCLLSGSW